MKEGLAARWGTFGPALLLMLALGALPLLNLVYTSFHTVTWSQGQASFAPAGFSHYAALVRDPLLQAGLANTIVFAIFAVGGQMALGFGLALLCSRIGRGRIVYRAVFMLPILIPGIVIGAIWKLMLNFDFGLINQAIELFGLEPRNWLGDEATALASVIVVDIWHWTPFCFLLLLAGLESLPQDPYEAARIDGASLGARAALHHSASDGTGAHGDLCLPAGAGLQGVRRDLPSDRRRSGHGDRGAELHALPAPVHRGSRRLRLG